MKILIIRYLATAFLTGLLIIPATLPESARGEEAASSLPTVKIPEETSLVTESGWSDVGLDGRSGHFHPFISLTEYYTDNLYNLSENEEDDFITVISPGLWLAYPAGNRQPLNVTTLSSAPGGLAVTRFPVETRRRFQSYALYRADIRKHHDFSEEDNTYQRAEGLLNINLRGGLSLELIDIFQVSQDPNSTGNIREVDEITSNLVQFLADYRIAPKTRVRADYSHYSIDFDDERNAFRERDDDVLNLYLFYRFLPRTSLLLEYDFINIDYQQEIFGDTKERTTFAGLRWEVSEKTQGLAKFGHSWRDIDTGSHEAFIGEIRLDYRFTPKTSTYLALTRRVEETDIREANSIIVHRAQLGYRQKITARWSATTDLFYYQNDYRGSDRIDDHFGARLGAGYLFRRWLNFGIGYNYIQRISNDDADYTNNRVFLSATAAL